MTADTRPEDGTTIEWWSISPNLLPSYISIRHMKAVWHSYTPWREHPFAENFPDRQGADFDNQWAIYVDSKESGWYGTARETKSQSVEALAASLFAEGRGNYRTQREALEAMIAAAKQGKAAAESRAHGFTAQLGALGSMLAQLTDDGG